MLIAPLFDGLRLADGADAAEDVTGTGESRIDPPRRVIRSATLMPCFPGEVLLAQRSEVAARVGPGGVAVRASGEGEGELLDARG